MSKNHPPIPVTILTGFLGSGKTTLLKRVLDENHGMKIAVIENEFGEENIDNEILLREEGEQILQMSNGCICCTIREDLRAGLSKLAEGNRKGELDFDRVVIETTGLADPGPVAQTFFLDDEIAMAYRLDAVITLVDAKHAGIQLNEHEVVQRQIGFADQLFLSKVDLVTEQAGKALRERLLKINPRVPMSEVKFGEIALQKIFDLHGFNPNDKLEVDADFLNPGKDDDHAHSHGEGDHHHHHSDKVRSFVFRSEKPFDRGKLENFLGAIIQVFGNRMLRYKGVLNIAGVDRRVVFQGVFEMMASDHGRPWDKDEKRESRMVFIGSDLHQEIILNGLQECLNSAG